MKTVKSMKIYLKHILFAMGMLSVGVANGEKINSEGEWKSSGITVKRGEEHTFWIYGLNEEQSMFLDVEGVYSYKEDGETWEDSVFPSEVVDVENAQGGYDQYVLLTAEDWEWVPASVSSVKFYAYVSGWYDEEVSANNKFSFGHASGRGMFPGDVQDAPVVPPGTASNPKTVTIKMLSLNDDSAGYVDCQFADEHNGSYHIRISNLIKDQKYRFGLGGISGTNVTFSMMRQGGKVNLFETAKAFTEWEGGCEQAYELKIDEAGTYEFVVSGGDIDDEFRFFHAGLPKLTPAQQESTELVVGDVSQSFRPGYRCDPNGYAWDMVIDQQLFKITGYKKGESYVFRTEGADAPLLMQLYDVKGNVLAENKYVAEGDNNVAVVWTATANYSSASAVYVGVCQRLEGEEEPTAGEVTLVAEKVELNESVSTLVAVPDTQERSPVDADGVMPTDVCTLSATEWRNIFVLAARAGVKYRLKAITGDSKGLMLTSRVYTVSGTKETELTVKNHGLKGSLDPDSEEWLEFTSSAHGNVYIEVFVARNAEGYLDGTGLSYGPYQLCVTAGGEYGILKADMKGAGLNDMGWKIHSGPGITPTKEVFYPAGASAILPAGDYVLLAKEVKGFVKPNAKGYASVKVVAGNKISEPEEYKYIDEYDPLDDQPDTKQKHPTLNKAYAPTKLAPTAAKPVEVQRSLWEDDSADWFTFSGAEGSYYAFEFAEKTGRPKISVYGPDNWTNECEYALKRDQFKAVQVSAKAKGTYYVKIAHADESAPEDSTYVLNATTATPGVLKLKASAISVKEDAPYVDVSVGRIGKDGIVRVKYRTEAIEAKPGKEYYPTNGVFAWENGDNKDKIVRIRLIPDLVPVWEENKTFKVVFETFSEEENLAEGEFIPAFTFDAKAEKPVDTAVITLTEASDKIKAVGSIQVADCETPKNPVFNVIAEEGKILNVPFERIDGTDGAVGIKVETVKKTANKTGEVDYVEKVDTLVWRHGENGRKNFSVTLKGSADWEAQKTFTLKITALTTVKNDPVQYGKPKAIPSTITINIRNNRFAQSMAEYTKGLPKNHDAILKETKLGTWVVNKDGSFQSVSLDAKNKVAEFTFTFVGPGKAQFKPYAEENVKLEYKVGNARIGTVWTNDLGLLTVYVPSGSQAVKFTATCTNGSSCVEFRNVDDDSTPYKWTGLAAAVAAAPTMDKAMVPAGTNELCFARDEGISYQVYALSTGAKNATNRLLKLGDTETEVFADENGRYMINLENNTVNKGKYTWRVDTYFEGGSVTNVAKKAWELNVAAEEAKPTRISGVGVWGEEFSTETGATVTLRKGVMASFEVGEESASAINVVSGKLPDGLKLAQDRTTKKWHLSGVPSKAGAYSAVIQASFKDAKNKVVPGATVAMDFIVEDAAAAIGSYTFAGPGKAEFSPVVSEGSALEYLIGNNGSAIVWTNKADKLVVYVASGKQTIKFAAAGRSGTPEVTLNAEDVVWTTLPTSTAVAPTMDKAVVPAGTNELYFVRDEGVSYRVYALSTGAKNAKNQLLKLGDAETEVLADNSGRYIVNLENNTVNKGKYTWRVDTYFEGGNITNVAKKAWELSVAAEGTLATRVKGQDVWGNEFDTTVGTNVLLRQCVAASFEIGDETVTAIKIVSGKFPDGLKLAQDKTTKKWLLSGVPSKAGVYNALLQASFKDATNKVVPGLTVAIDFTVEDAGTAIGKFRGLATTFDAEGISSLAEVSLDAKSDGKLSATVNIAGKKYVFEQKSGYSWLAGDENDPDMPLEVTAELIQIQKFMVDRVNYVYTNTLYYTVRLADTADTNAWYSVGDIRIEMAALPDAKGKEYMYDVWYYGQICRDNSALKEWQAEAKKFTGYYTVALVPEYAMQGEPCGNGYMTLTLDAKGTAKLVGALADGTKYSASSFAALWKIGDVPAVRIPLYLCKSSSVFGGWLAIRFPEGSAPVAAIESPDTDLIWKNEDAASTFDGEWGFSLNLVPVGGYYDTVYNLQRHYLEYDFEIDAPTDDDLAFLEEYLGDGYKFVAEASPNNEKIDMVGDSISMQKQTLVKDSTKKYNDWTASVNPSGLTVNFKRATGIIDGKCSLWYEGVNAKGVKEQKSLSNLSHAGVLLLNRDESGGYLNDDVWTAGSLVVPMTLGKRKWNGSFRFNLRAVKVDERVEGGSSWDEVEPGHKYADLETE